MVNVMLKDLTCLPFFPLLPLDMINLQKRFDPRAGVLVTPPAHFVWPSNALGLSRLLPVPSWPLVRAVALPRLRWLTRPREVENEQARLTTKAKRALGGRRAQRPAPVGHQTVLRAWAAP